MKKIPVCLAIGGSDSSGGAGIQADLATFHHFGIKGCSAITAITAQNPITIKMVTPMNKASLEAEISAVFAYYNVRAVKTGMLVDASIIHLIVDMLHQLHAGQTLIVDPVMRASSGRMLLDDDAMGVCMDRLFPLATLLTPNLPEAATLLGRPTTDMAEDAAALAMLTHTSVLLKGGHGEETQILDLLYESNSDTTPIPHARKLWNTDMSHGTGCRLASAIAACMAQRGDSLHDAVVRAIDWMQSDGLDLMVLAPSPA